MSFRIIMLLSALLLACTDGGTTPGTGGAGGAGGSSTGGAPAGPGGSGGGGGITIHPGVLVDDGLVARYYIDEADTGQTPTELVDHAPMPLNLAITYAPTMQFAVDAAGHRGLRFDLEGADGRASTAVDGSKLVGALQTSTTATIELVADVQGVTDVNSRIVYIGLDAEAGRFSLTSDLPTRLYLFGNDQELYASAAIDLPGTGRCVVHAVLDTAQTDPLDRARIYVNGSPLPNFDGTAPALDTPLDLGVGRHFVIGNREISGRTIRGMIYYTALYSTALSDVQVVQNALLLLESDDTPAP